MGSFLLQATGFQANASDSFSVYYSTTTNSVEQLLLPCVNRNELLAGISIDLPSTTYGLSVHNNGGDCDCIATAVVWPSPSPTPSATPSITPTVTVTPTITPTVTPSISVSPSITPTVTPSISITPTVTPSITVSNSVTPTVTPTATPSITVSNSATPTVTPTVTVTPTITPSPSRTPVTGSGTVSTVSGDAACTGGEAPFSSPPYTYYIAIPGTTLCDATEITTAGTVFDWINAEISTGVPFWISDRVAGVFYYRQFIKSSAGSTATPTAACVACGTPGVSPSPSAPIPQRNVRVFADRPGSGALPTQYLEYSLSTSPTSWVASCIDIDPGRSLTPYFTIAVDSGINVNFRAYDTNLGDRVEMDYTSFATTTPGTGYYTSASVNNQNECNPTFTINQDTDIYVVTSETGCGTFPADPCAGPSPSAPPP